MANGCKKEDAENSVAQYIEKIEDAKRRISKNFDDMDLENADVKEEYREIKESLVSDCENLISEIKSFNFN